MKTFEERLEAESVGWVAEGVIDSEQRRQLLQRHRPGGRDGSRFLAALATVGGALLVVGVSLIIKANWQELHDWVKIGGLLTLLVAAYVGGWTLKQAPGRYPKTGDACLMAGSVLFLLGIALISQVFHLNSRPANGILLWWAGIAAIPWLTRAKGAQLVSVIAGLVWLGLEFDAKDSWLELIAPARHADPFAFPREVFTYLAAYFLLGAALYGLGAALRKGSFGEFSPLHETLGLFLMTAVLYGIGMLWSADLQFGRALAKANPVVVAGLIGLTVLSLGIGFWRAPAVGRSLGFAIALGALPVVGVLAGASPFGSEWIIGGVACVALFVLNVAMIRQGLESGRESLVNAGIAGIAANIITRYFLLFGSLLDGGIFFLVSGALVLTLGYLLERQRRRWVRTIRAQEDRP